MNVTEFDALTKEEAYMLQALMMKHEDLLQEKRGDWPGEAASSKLKKDAKLYYSDVYDENSTGNI